MYSIYVRRQSIKKPAAAMRRAGFHQRLALKITSFLLLLRRQLLQLQRQ